MNAENELVTESGLHVVDTRLRGLILAAQEAKRAVLVEIGEAYVRGAPTRELTGLELRLRALRGQLASYAVLAGA